MNGMRRWLFASALTVVTVVSTAAPASAAPPTVAEIDCQESPRQRGGNPNIDLRLGPLAFHGWDNYATWESMDRFRQRGGFAYAKSPMFARAGSVATLYVSPADRNNVDVFYGGKRADVMRVRACSRRLSFYSGGLFGPRSQLRRDPRARTGQPPRPPQAAVDRRG